MSMMPDDNFYSESFKKLRDEAGQAPTLRHPYLEKIGKEREGRTVVSFFMSFYKQFILGQADADQLEEILCNSNIEKGITLILDAPGGDGLAAERIIQICRSYSKGDFETIVPARAKSAATMVCLGSDKILMSRTSELGPIDPQVPYDLAGVGQESWVAAYHITKTYKDLLEAAVNLDRGHIEPYLQQLQKFNAVHIEHLEQATKLSKDIAISTLEQGMLKGKDKETIEKLIERFTEPDITLSHGRGINIEQAKECGLEVEEMLLESELWKVVWGLYMRSKFVVEDSQYAKLIDTLDASYYV